MKTLTLTSILIMFLIIIPVGGTYLMAQVMGGWDEMGLPAMFIGFTSGFLGGTYIRKKYKP